MTDATLLGRARAAAARHRHDALSTVHLLLALLDGPAAEALAPDPGAARRALAATLPRGPGTPPGQLPLTPGVRALLEAGLARAAGRGADRVEEADLAGALADVPWTYAGRWLAQRGRRGAGGPGPGLP